MRRLISAPKTDSPTAEKVAREMRQVAHPGGRGPASMQSAGPQFALQTGPRVPTPAGAHFVANPGPPVTDTNLALAARVDRTVARIAPQLGLDSKSVKVRLDSGAVALTRAAGTSGVMQDGAVFLDPSELVTSEQEGLELLAHELAHVAQSRNSGQVPFQPAAAEAEAQQLGEAAAAGEAMVPPVEVLPGGVTATYGDLPSDLTTEIDEEAAAEQMLEARYSALESDALDYLRNLSGSWSPELVLEDPPPVHPMDATWVASAQAAVDTMAADLFKLQGWYPKPSKKDARAYIEAETTLFELDGAMAELLPLVSHAETAASITPTIPLPGICLATLEDLVADIELDRHPGRVAMDALIAKYDALGSDFISQAADIKRLEKSINRLSDKLADIEIANSKPFADQVLVLDGLLDELPTFRKTLKGGAEFVAEYRQGGKLDASSVPGGVTYRVATPTPDLLDRLLGAPAVDIRADPEALWLHLSATDLMDYLRARKVKKLVSGMFTKEFELDLSEALGAVLAETSPGSSLKALEAAVDEAMSHSPVTGKKNRNKQRKGLKAELVALVELMHILFAEDPPIERDFAAMWRLFEPKQLSKTLGKLIAEKKNRANYLREDIADYGVYADAETRTPFKDDIEARFEWALDHPGKNPDLEPVIGKILLDEPPDSYLGSRAKEKEKEKKKEKWHKKRDGYEAALDEELTNSIRAMAATTEDLEWTQDALKEALGKKGSWILAVDMVAAGASWPLGRLDYLYRQILSYQAAAKEADPFEWYASGRAKHLLFGQVEIKVDADLVPSLERAAQLYYTNVAKLGIPEEDWIRFHDTTGSFNYRFKREKSKKALLFRDPCGNAFRSKHSFAYALDINYDDGRNPRVENDDVWIVVEDLLRYVARVEPERADELDRMREALVEREFKLSKKNKLSEKTKHTHLVPRDEQIAMVLEASRLFRTYYGAWRSDLLTSLAQVLEPGAAPLADLPTGKALKGMSGALREALKSDAQVVLDAARDRVSAVEDELARISSILTGQTMPSITLPPPEGDVLETLVEIRSPLDQYWLRVSAASDLLKKKASKLDVRAVVDLVEEMIERHDELIACIDASHTALELSRPVVRTVADEILYECVDRLGLLVLPGSDWTKAEAAWDAGHWAGGSLLPTDDRGRVERAEYYRKLVAAVHNNEKKYLDDEKKYLDDWARHGFTDMPELFIWAMEQAGWTWGGQFRDYHHFEYPLPDEPIPKGPCRREETPVDEPVGALDREDSDRLS